MKNDNDLTVTLTQALQDIKKEQGEDFSPETVNLAELQRRTGISRAKLRRLKSNNFKEKPHGLTGTKAAKTVISGYESVINNQLRQGVTNSVNIFDKLKEVGYRGSLSGVKRYIIANRNLVPAKRQLVEPQGSRGIRYFTTWRSLSDGLGIHKSTGLFRL